VKVNAAIFVPLKLVSPLVIVPLGGAKPNVYHLRSVARRPVQWFKLSPNILPNRQRKAAPINLYFRFFPFFSSEIARKLHFHLIQWCRSDCIEL
jgi:hypothetical protein